MYVTLEPCAHKNVNGLSCVDQIYRTGIKEVFVGCVDPDPRTNKKGINLLKKKEIKVHENFLKDQATKLYNGFFFKNIKQKTICFVKNCMFIRR